MPSGSKYPNTRYLPKIIITIPNTKALDTLCLGTGTLGHDGSMLCVACAGLQGTGHLGIVQLLLEAGADRDRIEGDSVTPLGMASSCGRVDVARLLLKEGADKDAELCLARLCGLELFSSHIQRLHVDI